MSGSVVRFAGYAGLFDIADADRDTIRRGAFEQTLRNRESPVPLLWQHRPGDVIGFIEMISEDPKGLRVVGRIESLKSRAAALLKRGEINGLSFGYRALEIRKTHRGRELLRLDLFEVSLVTHPLQNGARVHLVC